MYSSYVLEWQLCLSEALNYLRGTTVQECTWNMLLLPDTAPPRHTGTVRMTTGVLYMLKAPCIYVKVTNTQGGGITTYADSKHTVEHQELGDVFGNGQKAKYSFHKKCPQILNTHLHGSTWQVTSACQRKLTVLFTDIKLAISRNLSFWVPHTLINPLNCSIHCNFWNAYLMKPCRSRRIALYE